MCTLRIVILRTVNRPRTAPTVRLSLSAIIVGFFPASTISRNCLSSSGSQRRSLAFSHSGSFHHAKPMTLLKPFNGVGQVQIIEHGNQSG